MMSTSYIANSVNSSGLPSWQWQLSSYVSQQQADLPMMGSRLLALVFASVLLLVYVSSPLNFWMGLYLKKGGQTPLTLPYALPVFGHALWYSWDTQSFALMAKYVWPARNFQNCSDILILLCEIRRKFQEVPVKLRLIVMNPVLITKAEDVVHVFAQSAAFTNKPYRNFVSSTFGLPRKFSEFYIADDSGWRHKAHPQSCVKPENRVDYLMHNFITRFFSGTSLIAFTGRFTINMTNRLENTGFGDEWAEGIDLFKFLKTQIFHAFVEAVFGTHIFELNPDLCDDFWAFDSKVPDLAKGIPKWLSPNMYGVRDRCLQSILKWHLHLQKHGQEETTTINKKYDPVFGSELMQQRHQAFSNMSSDIVCAQAKASEDLALMWA